MLHHYYKNGTMGLHTLGGEYIWDEEFKLSCNFIDDCKHTQLMRCTLAD